MSGSDSSTAAVWDAIVVGAGPTGSTAARCIASQGRSVLLVDRARFPRDKVCGCCVGSLAVDQLVGDGLGSALRGGQPLRRFALGVGGRTRVQEAPLGLAVPRSSFDHMLAEAAQHAGATFCQQTAAQVGCCHEMFRNVALRSEESEQNVRARIVIVADGLNGGALNALPEFVPTVRPASRVGVSTLLETAPAEYQPGTIYMACARGCYAGLVRLADGRLNLAAALDPGYMKLFATPAAAIQDTLRSSGFADPPGLERSTWRGTPALTRERRCLAGPRLLVAGDAAGYVEPFTGEGIAWGLADGRAAGKLALQALCHWNDAMATEWNAVHRSLIVRRQGLCRAARLIAHRPWATEALSRLFGAAPALFRRVAARLRAPLIVEQRA